MLINDFAATLSEPLKNRFITSMDEKLPTIETIVDLENSISIWKRVWLSEVV
jgi:DNA/RNA-binding domain of Phe-tRNA-synthetase-like protein